MKHRNHTLFACMLLALVAVACVALFAGRARAEEVDYAQSGDGWSISADGVMKIESNEGWLNCMLQGYNERPIVLVIGKEVTSFRLYNLPFDMPVTDLIDGYTFDGRDKDGKVIHTYQISHQMFPQEILVEEGNPVFKMIDGLLVNFSTHELVLSEVGVTNVEIPEGVETITREAFSKREVTSIQFPRSLRKICYRAFADCESLRAVALPDSVLEMEEGVFSGCISLQDVSLPNQIKSIPEYMFYQCAFESIEIPSTVEEIGDRAFYECNKLLKFVCPPNLKIIGMNSFADCTELREINLPEGLEVILDGAFSWCSSLRVVILPDSLKQVGDGLVCWCDLTLLRVPAHLEFVKFNPKTKTYMPYPYSKSQKRFILHSVDTVILSGSDYDFGYSAITDANNVYFLGKPPEDVGLILDEDSVENIYCSDEFEFEWTRSTVASWVRQRLTILPADQINTWAETTINTTPEPTNTPRPTLTPRPTETPWPTPMPRPTASPVPTAEPEQTIDPIIILLIVFIVLVIAAVVLLYLKPWAKKKRRKKRKPVPQMPAGMPKPNDAPEPEHEEKPE